MKSMIRYIAVVLLLFCILPLEALGKELIPVGKVIGLELRSGSVTIAAFDEELGAAAQAAGLQAGDVIVQIDDVAVASSDDVRRALARSHGAVRMTVSRGGQQQELTLTPQITRDGPKLGAYLKQGVTGIGTVTWYDPDSGDFATLGHGVNNVNGKLLSMTEGFAYDARVLSVRQGKPGDPGQLMGAVERLEPVGTLRANTAQGVFGKCTRGWNGAERTVAQKDEIRTGEAKILSTVSGTEVREYSVEILKIYPKAKLTGRNLLIKVTDPELLAATGGIVQGMSGSPIIQNGKLVGAVTHVLVNDPTTGYGIFIENMLDAAG